jgi:sugar phosphate isomerase/epimerase
MHKNLGAQLYTIREFTQTLENIDRSLERIASIGYTAIQISAFGPVDPREVAKLVQLNGLTVAGTHMGWDRFLNSIDEVIENHKLWGCRHAAIGGLPPEYFSLEGLDRFLDELQPVAEKLAEAGIDF